MSQFDENLKKAQKVADEMLKKTLEDTVHTLNLSSALKKAMDENDMDTVRRLSKEMEKILAERKIRS